MSDLQLKKLLADTINSEAQLYDFCIECIEHIFKEDAPMMKADFRETYESLDEGYGLSLYNMLKNEETRKSKIAELKNLTKQN